VLQEVKLFAKKDSVQKGVMNFKGNGNFPDPMLCCIFYKGNLGILLLFPDFVPGFILVKENKCHITSGFL